MSECPNCKRYREALDDLFVHATPLDVAPGWVCVPSDEWEQAMRSILPSPIERGETPLFGEV